MPFGDPMARAAPRGRPCSRPGCDHRHCGAAHSARTQETAWLRFPGQSGTCGEVENGSRVPACGRPQDDERRWPTVPCPVPCPEPRTPESRVPSPESRVPSPESRVPCPESRVPSPVSRVLSPESRVPSSEFRVPSSEFRVPSSEPCPAHAIPLAAAARSPVWQWCRAYPGAGPGKPASRTGHTGG